MEGILPGLLMYLLYQCPGKTQFIFTTGFQVYTYPFLVLALVIIIITSIYIIKLRRKLNNYRLQNLRGNNENLPDKILHEKLQQERTSLKHFLRKLYNAKIVKERKLLLDLINSMPDRIYFKDRESRFLLANKMLAEICGVKSPDEMTGKTDFDFFPKEIAEEYYRDDMKIIQSGKAVVNKEEVGRDKNGKMIIKSVTKVPVRDESNEIIGLVGISRDISRQKEAERILEEKSENLRQINILLEKSKNQVQNQAEELKKINHTRDKLYNIIAHDLKSPFHSIMGISELMNDNYDNMEEDKKRLFIRLIHESSTNVYYLLENLLNWARTQSGTIRYNPLNVNVNKIIQQNIHLAKPALEKKKIKLEIPDEEQEEYLLTDPDMMHSVIRNLLNNAIKFTKEGGSIKVEMKNKGTKMLVSVSDTGYGISPELQDKLLSTGDIFSSQGTDGEAGTGLGLAICKEFTEKMGGEISLESEPGKGSTFTLALPVNTEKKITEELSI